MGSIIKGTIFKGTTIFPMSGVGFRLGIFGLTLLATIAYPFESWEDNFPYRWDILVPLGVNKKTREVVCLDYKCFVFLVESRKNHEKKRPCHGNPQDINLQGVI